MPIQSRAFRKLPGTIALAFLLVGSLTASAQTTQQAIEARLKGHPLYLRGQWKSNKLRFDLAGVTSSPAISASFTLCGMDVNKVQLTDQQLEVDGDRIGLEFDNNKPKRVSLHTKIQIVITGSPNADYTLALDNIFADGLPALVPAMPFYWQEYAQTHLLPGVLQPTATSPKPPTPAHFPQLLQSAEAEFTDTARELGYANSSLVHILVEKDGTVHEPYIVRPAGLGLDEQALYAVARYRFKPAMEDSNPVPVLLDIEVDFQFLPR